MFTDHFKNALSSKNPTKVLSALEGLLFSVGVLDKWDRYILDDMVVIRRKIFIYRVVDVNDVVLRRITKLHWNNVHADR